MFETATLRTHRSNAFSCFLPLDYKSLTLRREFCFHFPFEWQDSRDWNRTFTPLRRTSLGSCCQKHSSLVVDIVVARALPYLSTAQRHWCSISKGKWKCWIQSRTSEKKNASTWGNWFFISFFTVLCGWGVWLPVTDDDNVVDGNDEKNPNYRDLLIC